MKHNPWLRTTVVLLLAGFFALVFTAPVRANDEPTIAKDTLHITARMEYNSPEGKWKPAISFRVNGPIATGSQLWVDFSYPGNKAWAKMDCDTGDVPAGKWWKIGECYPADRALTSYAGMIDFGIHLRNELQGTNTT